MYVSSCLLQEFVGKKDSESMPWKKRNEIASSKLKNSTKFCLLFMDLATMKKCDKAVIIKK